jgi:hypothetical protein
MDDDFGIGMGQKPMSLLNKVFTKLDVIEDLPVEYNPNGFILVMKRLAPGAEINNAQPGHPHPKIAIHKKTTFVRSAMVQR